MPLTVWLCCSWLAILAAMILSLASAWPIFLVCELPKCAHQHPEVFDRILKIVQPLNAILK